MSAYLYSRSQVLKRFYTILRILNPTVSANLYSRSQVLESAYFKKEPITSLISELEGKNPYLYFYKVAAHDAVISVLIIKPGQFI